MLYGFIDTRAQTFTLFLTSTHFFDRICIMECAQMISLYYLENLLSDEIFKGGPCLLNGQRSPHKHLIKYKSKKAFLIFLIFA